MGGAELRVHGFEVGVCARRCQPRGVVHGLVLGDTYVGGGQRLFERLTSGVERRSIATEAIDRLARATRALSGVRS